MKRIGRERTINERHKEEPQIKERKEKEGREPWMRKPKRFAWTKERKRHRKEDNLG